MDYEISHYARHEIKFVLNMPPAYFMREAYFMLQSNISLVPQERISLKKAKSFDLAFFWWRRRGSNS